MLWLNYLINQPNNFLANTLGLGSHWYSSFVASNLIRKYTTLTYIFLNYYIRIMFKGGFLWANHPFINPLFNFFNPDDHIHSLPNYITNLTVVKFFRVRRLKLGSDVRLRSQFVFRNYKKYLNMSKLYIYFCSSWILLSIYAYIPSIYKRRFKAAALQNTSLSTPRNFEYTNTSLKNSYFNSIIFKKVFSLHFQILSVF
jgi:hypothetical protein